MLLVTAVGVAGCVASTDGRPALETCDYGLFHADCGGDGEPVLACSEEGECRWFLGGVVATGHEVSGCSAESVCCVSGWAFDGWTPSVTGGTARAQSRLGVLWRLAAPVSADSPPSTLTLATTPAGPPAGRPSVMCDAINRSMDGLCIGVLDFETRRDGESFVMELGSLGGTLLVEAVPGGGARAFYRLDVFDSDTGPYCGGNLGGGVVEGSGTLTLDPGAFDEPASAHGVLDLTLDAGGRVRVAF